MKYFLLTFFLISCGTVDEQSPTDQMNIEAVRELVTTLKAELETKEDEHGWLFSDCDGMLWEGKYRAVVGGGNLAAAAYPDEPGRYRRRPEVCWIKGRAPDEQDSRNTFSGDMGRGLSYWLLRSENIEALEEHIAYGEANGWKMGEPASDGGPIYKLPLRSAFRNAAAHLKGEKLVSWNGFFVTGKDDFAAHLETIEIAFRGEITGSIPEPALAVMIRHTERYPMNPFYQAVVGRFQGDNEQAIESCLAPEFDTYVRCEGGPCEKVEQLFACDYILRTFN